MIAWKRRETYDRTKTQSKDSVQSQIGYEKGQERWLIRRLYKCLFWVRMFPIFVVTINGKLRVDAMEVMIRRRRWKYVRVVYALFVLYSTWAA